MHHSYGLVYYCFKSLLAPLTLVIMPSWDLEFARTLIPKYVPLIPWQSTRLNITIRYHITHLTFVPSIVHQLVHHPKISKAEFSSIIAINSGAAYLPPELKDKLYELAPAQTRFMEGMFVVEH